jgi:OFA family oxalate/formate antiporter-like MFS transporter
MIYQRPLSAANAGMLYTAKGTGALLVPFAAAIAKTNGWETVFLIGVSFNLLAVALALFALKPLRARHFAMTKATGASAWARH